MEITGHVANYKCDKYEAEKPLGDDHVRGEHGEEYRFRWCHLPAMPRGRELMSKNVPSELAGAWTVIYPRPNPRPWDTTYVKALVAMPTRISFPLKPGSSWVLGSLRHLQDLYIRQNLHQCPSITIQLWGQKPSNQWIRADFCLSICLLICWLVIWPIAAALQTTMINRNMNKHWRV